MKKVLFATILSLGLFVGCAKQAITSNPEVFMGRYVGSNNRSVTLVNDASTMKLTDGGGTRTFMYVTDGTGQAKITAEILPGGALSTVNIPTKMYRGETKMIQVITGTEAVDFIFVSSN